MISFGNLFGLQDVYEDDNDVRIQGGSRAESSGSVEVTIKNWQDQENGVSDKPRIRIKKSVHFGGARKIPEEKCAENKEYKAVAMLSLSV